MFKYNHFCQLTLMQTKKYPKYSNKCIRKYNDLKWELTAHFLKFLDDY